jgi:hypothetical protein
VKPLAPAVSDIETYGAMLGTAFIEKPPICGGFSYYKGF